MENLLSLKAEITLSKHIGVFRSLSPNKKKTLRRKLRVLRLPNWLKVWEHAVDRNRGE